MQIRAEKQVRVWADVVCNGWDYRVYPNGVVERWVVGDEDVHGFWSWMSDSDNDYDVIKAAGLRCLSDDACVSDC